MLQDGTCFHCRTEIEPLLQAIVPPSPQSAGRFSLAVTAELKRETANQSDATVLPLLAYPTMEYKGIHYSVVQTLGAAFKWTVRLANGERIGVARDRTLATLHAIKAIDEDERQIRAAF